MTLEQYVKLDTLSTARRDLFMASLREVSEQAAIARERPTGGKRGRYLTAIKLMDASGKGYIVLNPVLFATPSLDAKQNRFNQVCDELNKREHVTIWEHPDGTLILVDFTHPDGDFNFSCYLLKKDHGFTDAELREMATQRLADADEIEASDIMDEMIDDVFADEAVTV
jgi:hypothetical protein